MITGTKEADTKAAQVADLIGMMEDGNGKTADIVSLPGHQCYLVLLLMQD